MYISEIFPDVKRGLGVWGGGERQFYEISRRIAQLGHDITVLTCRFPGQPSEEIIEGMKIIRVGLSRDPKTGGARKVILPIFSYIFKTVIQAIQSKPDIIHCNTYFPVYSGSLASFFEDIPLISTFHDVYGLKGWIKSQDSSLWGTLGHLATFFATKANNKKIIAVSPQCKQKLISYGIQKDSIVIVPNGVDLNLFDSVNPPKKNNQILYVGRLVNFKHVDWLLHAFSYLLKEVPDAFLKVVGSGPEWTNLHELANELGISSRVLFTGKTSTYEEVTKYFKESKMLVLPSVVEGEAIVLKEAMAASLPVIAMNVPGSGVLSLLHDKKNGYLVKPGDPNLLCEKMLQLLKSPKNEKMGELGRKLIESHDWNIIAERTLRIYSQIIESYE